MFNLPQRFHKKINLISLILIAVTLPFHILLCSYSIALFVLNQLIEGQLIEKFKRSLSNPYAFAFILFFLIHIIGLTYTENLKGGLFEIEKKVALLLFPLVLLPTTLERNEVIKVLASFVTACIVLSLVFLGNSIYKFSENHNWEMFMLQNLSEATGMHRVYASMYFLFCIFLLIFMRDQKSVFKFSPLIYNFLIIYFATFIFLLASRMIVLLTILSLGTVLSYSLLKAKNKLPSLIMLGLFLALVIGILLLNERTRTVMRETYTDLDKGNTETNFTGPNMRIIIWKASLEIAKEHPLGVGTGDAEQELYSNYLSTNFKWGIQNRFNAHNQYFQTLIELGIAGLLLLLVSLAVPSYISFKERRYLYVGFVLLFAIVCVSESMLATQKGVVFYAFFNSLLFFHYPAKNS